MPVPLGVEGAHQHRATAASHLTRDSVGLVDLVLPVASPHRDNRELDQSDDLTDGRGYFLGALNTQTDLSIVVPNGDKCLERLLARVCLLLPEHNLQNLFWSDAPGKSK